MYDSEKFWETVPPDADARLSELPYDIARRDLYTASELFDAFDPADPSSFNRCLDTRIACHVAASGGGRPAAGELFARMLHDAHVRAALRRRLDWFEEKRVVGVMGGHALARTDVYYRRVVEAAKALTERGRLMIGGGGPGAMEATHVGAWLAGRDMSDVDAALDLLTRVPTAADAASWLAAAFDVMARFPQEKGFASISVPTWHFGHEPPTPFATHIAKLFDNGIREETLLAEAYGGVVFMPGGAGTLQEIFQDAVQNHYVRLGRSSPMVFVGVEFWTQTLPAYPLLERLVSVGRFKNVAVSLVETTDEIVAALEG